MPSKSAHFQYALLALTALLGLIHVSLGVGLSYQDLVHGTTTVAPPFSIGPGSHTLPLTPSQAQSAGVPQGFTLATILSTDERSSDLGPHAGDAIYTIDGIQITNRAIRDQILSRHLPGQSVEVTFWKAGTSLESPPLRATIRLLPERDTPASLLAWALGIAFTILPVFCLATGWYVVLARPRSAYSWLILGILGYASALLLHPLLTTGFVLPFSLIWITFGQAAMALCFMLFGIYFPERAPIDIRFPWIKWLVLVPIVALVPFDLYSRFTLVYSFRLYAYVAGWDTAINNAENIISTIGIFYAFYCLQEKLHQPDLSADARRRLQVLNAGSSIGLTPFFVLLVISLVRGVDFGLGVPRWFELTVLALFLIFPLTLAYVVVVQRAMDVRILLRQGTKYFFAKQSIFVIGVLLATWMAYNISVFFSTHDHRVVDVVRIIGIIAWFFVFRTIGAKRMQRKIDEKFFREAYSTEQLLSELSDEARNFTEIAPLLQTITGRLGATLHIERIAVFLRSGEIFQLQFSTGFPISPGHLPVLAATSTTITHLTRGKSAPANVYRDDPTSWLVDATDAERTALADLSTELLVPLPGRNRLVGVIALGPKSSEEPYSKADRQLLQSVASQTGLALENAELFESLTAELNQRARTVREAEIAREVQERLFPQTYPSIPGIDLAGFCRPAYFVGGDYYDFFLIPKSGGSTANRLAIAIGDISGKGVSAALLMASLRASLRSVATLQQPEVASTSNLATLMRHVNRLVYEASTSNRYATFFYAELNPATLILSYVNAGHNCPVILRHGKAIQLEPTGTVVGLLPEATYDQAAIQLQTGDMLLAFTDGISEAMTAEEEEWGEDRMIAAAQHLLTSDNPSTAQELLESLLAKADAFTAGAPQHDDMTLLLATIA